MAGADDADAFLTAREIAAIDLHDTRLVVLSACDTGIGQMAWSEGIYGLRRALAIAGAQTQVVSLWIAVRAPPGDEPAPAGAAGWARLRLGSEPHLAGRAP